MIYTCGPCVDFNIYQMSKVGHHTFISPYRQGKVVFQPQAIAIFLLHQHKVDGFTLIVELAQIFTGIE